MAKISDALHMIESSIQKVRIKYDHRISDELYTLIADEYLRIDKYKFLIELRTSGNYDLPSSNINNLSNTLDQIDKLLSIFKLNLDYQLDL